MYEAGLVRDFFPVLVVGGGDNLGFFLITNAKVFKNAFLDLSVRLPHIHVGLRGGGELGHEMGRRVCKNVLKLKFSSLQ